MPSSHPRAARACWLLLLAAMAAVGAMELRWDAKLLLPAPRRANVSSDVILASLTAEGDVVRRMEAEFARLPADRPVLILRPPRAVATSLAGYMVAYHAIPRRVLIREARLGDSAAAVAALREEFSAVVFVGQEPPAAFPQGVSFGESFVFVHLPP